MARMRAKRKALGLNGSGLPYMTQEELRVRRASHLLRLWKSGQMFLLNPRFAGVIGLNPEQRKARREAYLHAKRARTRFLPHEPITRETLAKRDRWRCHICKGKVVKTNWSIDHLIPLSKGGSHLYVNVALAHRLCNIRRHTGGRVQLRLLG